MCDHAQGTVPGEMGTELFVPKATTDTKIFEALLPLVLRPKGRPINRQLRMSSSLCTKGKDGHQDIRGFATTGFTTKRSADQQATSNVIELYVPKAKTDTKIFEALLPLVLRPKGRPISRQLRMSSSFMYQRQRRTPRYSRLCYHWFYDQKVGRSAGNFECHESFMYQRQRRTPRYSRLCYHWFYDQKVGRSTGNFECMAWSRCSFHAVSSGAVPV